MKTALIITYYWPPSGGAGVQRWLKFVKYLRGFGWEPVIYTPENPEFPETDESLFTDIPENLTVLKTSIREPYGAYKTFIGRAKKEKINASFLSEKKRNPFLENISVWIRGNIFIPDARMLWIKPSVKFLQRYLAENPVDIIISTGPPHSMHMIGMKVSRQLKLPWIADFRDPWTHIDFYRDLRLTSWADSRHRKMEKQVLARASAVISISPTMATDFNNLYPRDYEVITNGFDMDDANPSADIEPDRKFTISHIGTMVSTRNPVVFWKAIQSVLKENADFGRDLLIKLVGKVDFKVRESIEQSGLSTCVEYIGYTPHREVVKIQQQSQVLLLVINDTPNAAMILTGKFYEYLAARRPILCLGPVDGDAAKILAETKSGLIAGFKDVEKMKENILTLYRQFKAGNLSAGNQDIEAYSRKELTRKLAAVMDSLITKTL
jgi:glycosyltransferase involved in cell wall biosynthesis